VKDLPIISSWDQEDGIETGLQDLGGGIKSLIGGTDMMNMVRAPVLGAPTDNHHKIEKISLHYKSALNEAIFYMF
jgi:hypothetical protein